MSYYLCTPMAVGFAERLSGSDNGKGANAVTQTVSLCMLSQSKTDYATTAFLFRI